MKVINTKTNCVGCTRCIRKCRVNAMYMENGQACISEDLCVLCGECIKSCPMGALFYQSDTRKVQSWLEAGRKVVLSISPAYYAAWEHFSGRQVITALRQAGFSAIHETSEAMAAITSEYADFVSVNAMNNIITSYCPTINRLIQVYYPDLIQYMAPIKTPISAHGEYLRKKYGDDAIIVYAGPCYSQAKEAMRVENEKAIDAVLTLEELHRLIHRMNLNVTNLPESEPDNADTGIHMRYTTAGGVIQALRLHKGFPDTHYTSFHISGLGNCMSVLEEIQKGYYNNCVIELSACAGGCVNGPAKPKHGSGTKNNLLLERDFTSDNVTPDFVKDFLKTTTIGCLYYDRSVDLPMPSDEEIKDILKTMGRANKLLELDCGGCGYPTCRANAIAIHQGRSTIDTCIQYLHNKARSLSGFILEATPNLILLVDNQLKIREFSRSCQLTFKVTPEEAIGKDLIELIDDSDVRWVLENKTNIKNREIELIGYNKWVLATMIYLKFEDQVLLLMVDITAEKKKEQEEMKKRREIAEVAQRVINNQMMTAQTIAGLLGETTAETKVTLNKLVKSLLGEEGGDQ